MSGEREQELKRRLASVLWDAVEECVQRLDGESVKKKPPAEEMPPGGEHSFKCCGEIKHIPPVGPSPKEDSTDEDWTTMLQPMLKDDQERCESWDKEVQNILIFAALFSAVVTSFLLSSFPLLQPEGQAGPLPSSIRINVFWSLSLVLSLTTALIGIIAAQWLREHLSYPEYLTPEQMFALLNMKISMLKKWHVRSVISSLSVLLQISLLLFFAGLIQFLLSLEVNAVTIPVTIFVILSTLFPIVTTVLPALHVYAWQKKTTIEEDVPVPCPYKSPQAELFYILAMALSNYRPLPELFSLIYAFVTFIPTALVTGAILAKFHLHRIFTEGEKANLGRKVLAAAVGKPISLFFRTFKSLSTATDSVLYYLHEVRTNVRSSKPMHYNRTMALFRPPMEDESELWWAFDVAWVSIRRDYAFRLYASRAWSGKIDAHRYQIMQEWESGDTDPRMAWGKANSREANARAGPPWDQIQGLILLRHQYQNNDSDLNVMEAALRCFKTCVSPFRAYDNLDDGLAGVNNWMIGFEDATTEILRPHVKEEITFANLSQYVNESSRGLGLDLCTASFYHEALFHFLGNLHLEKLPEKGEGRLKTAWVEIYYKLVRCLPSSEELQHIDVPFAFATCSRDVSSVTPQFSQEEEQDLQEIYLEKAKSCAERLDKYRAEGATASDGLRNQVLHDFFFAVGAPPLFARQDKVQPDIQKLVSSLSEFCQYVKQRHNPNVVNLADRIENALGDTVDNYLEDSQLAFGRVSDLPLDYGALATREINPPVFSEDVMPSPGPSYTARDMVEPEPLIREPLVSVGDVMPSPGPHHSSEDLVEQEFSVKEEPLVSVGDVMPLPGPHHSSEDLVGQESSVKEEPLVSGEVVISPGPTHEGETSPGPSHPSPDLEAEEILRQDPQEVVTPLYRPYITSDRDSWEGGNDLW